ncbi:putative ABC transport system permease protein [Georgenia satyanarayanai]|uniref:Putative ABC transport system permease protein n=1 Tax=Georgenia satyanarayanai TaxID=860221 RepID=A0A2Y9A9W2_9MICO|nr:FtsX-like permease family protein [Georgenia satyanarayanai]PYG00320.1 putative ABC transport system permease protein [Georgenia satyanarayanai]SSA40706.1 putative ABC transport system permease protein [Georgenia satyanarayanai]
MLRLTLTQMRRSTGRLLAAGLAIMLGTAFIAATLLGTAVIRDTTYDAVTADIADADVVVPAGADLITPEQLDEVRALPGVAVADGHLAIFGSLVAGGRQDWSSVETVGSPGLSGATLLDGALPTAPGEAAINAASAERLEVGLGDTVDISADVYLPAPAGAEESTPVTEGELTVVGLLQDPSPLVGTGSAVLVTEAQRDTWVAETDRDLAFDEVLVRAADGTTPEALAADVADVLPETTVYTGESFAQQRLQELTGQAYVLTAVILAFGALAMFVAAIVITNTFQVLVAQRTHTLALLRAVGATKRQVRRSVLTEALILGVVAGVAGLLLGTSLAQGALWVLGTQDLPFAIPGSVSITAAAVIVPVVTGALVTVLAALSPARAATVVSPLAALRPPQPPDPRGASRLRVVASILLIVAGGVMVAVAPSLAASDIGEETALLAGLALGILGGFVSFAGVMLGMVFVVPSVVRVLGSVTRRLGGGTPARIATANAVRNPRRTAATATALVIGVTLVALMSTGAVSARASLDAMLRSEFPVDLVVTSSAWDPETGRTASLTDAQRDTVERTDNVAETLEISEAVVTLSTAEGEVETSVALVDRAAAEEVMRDASTLEGLESDTLLVGSTWAKFAGVTDGQDVTLGDAELSVVVGGGGDWAYAPAGLREAIDPEASVTELWVRLSGTEHSATITAVSDRLTEAQSATSVDDPDAMYNTPYVDGPAAQREVFEQVINTLLAIVVGLLAVAVVIALIGVANTLSLSVIERRRESALLRAMGLTRGQLRRMLAVEGVFLALAGVLIGAVLGLLYGWAGTAVLLGPSGELALAVPWAYLGAIVVVALLAGLAASVLPARSAVRTPPVAALAAE